MAIGGEENTYDVGDVVRVTATFTANTPAAVTVKVLKPDGATSTPSVVNDGGGVYHADVTADQAGRWLYRVSGTSPGAAAEEGSFAVRVQQVT